MRVLGISGVSLRPFSYAVVFALATLLLHQTALLTFVRSTIDFSTVDGLTVFGLLEAVQLTLTVILMTLIGTVSRFAMKVTGAVLLVTNAAAQYFMTTYSIVLDRSMIGNILATDTAEAQGLVHTALIVSVIIWGMLPALVALAIPVKRGRLLAQGGALVLLLMGTLGAAWAGSGVWLWFDAHSSAVGSRMLPWSYLGNSLRLVDNRRRRDRLFTLLPDATLMPLDGQRRLVVLVIGEAARRDHLAYYGYERDTSPFTRELGMIAIDGGRSCTTYTLGSVACMLAAEGAATGVTAVTEPLPDYLQRSGVPTLVRVNNSGIPALTHAQVRDRSEFVDNDCGPSECPENNLDGSLLRGLASEIAQIGERGFVLLHFNGSHGPEYFRKYPPEFGVFTPQCESVLLSDCTRQSLINAYDNSVRYTDRVLADLISQLDEIPQTEVLLLYVSDHGQSLGENGIYLHGLPNAIAPEEQRIIPYLVWMNEDFMRARNIGPSDLPQTIESPHDTIFHTVLGALGVQSEVHDPYRDILSERFQ